MVEFIMDEIEYLKNVLTSKGADERIINSPVAMCRIANKLVDYYYQHRTRPVNEDVISFEKFVESNVSVERDNVLIYAIFAKKNGYQRMSDSNDKNFLLRNFSYGVDQKIEFETHGDSIHVDENGTVVLNERIAIESKSGNNEWDQINQEWRSESSLKINKDGIEYEKTNTTDSRTKIFSTKLGKFKQDARDVESTTILRDMRDHTLSIVTRNPYVCENRLVDYLHPDELGYAPLTAPLDYSSDEMKRISKQRVEKNKYYVELYLPEVIERRYRVLLSEKHNGMRM